MIQIEKNIPMPADRATGMHYPYADMEVGDSFYVETNGTNELATARRLRGSSHAFTRRNGGEGKKFSVRKMDNGFRVWRVQ